MATGDKDSAPDLIQRLLALEPDGMFAAASTIYKAVLENARVRYEAFKARFMN
ncbi:MAG: hypothetical protein BMS9Abin05_1739 [Rhodothermia bacterium]|nr:MAG: hypothetical protein BMS9Abin05_1739 [Rhodothermia bacterium]